MMALFNKYLCVSLCVLTVWSVSSTDTDRQATVLLATQDDEYKLNGTKDIVKLRIDSTGVNWTSAANLSQLNLLQNDELAYHQPQTCIQQMKREQSRGTVQQTDQFVDIAERVGFTHSYHQHMPSRPDCLFDFVMPVVNSSPQTRLKGEFCVSEKLSGSVAVADYDNDGYPDIFFTVFGGTSRLYKNNGDGTFVDVTLEANVGPANYASGAVWADFDADGDMDLYVTSVGNTRHYLYVNQGGRFTEEAVERNCTCLQPDGRRLSGMTPNVGDFNRDGYPDLYVTEWRQLSNDEVSCSRLFRNMGSEMPGYFEDVTDKAIASSNLWTSENHQPAGTFTFCSSMTDFDEDGWPELLVTAGYGGSKLFWNNRNGTFVECTEPCGLTRNMDAAGHAIGDWDGDSHLDWFSTGTQDPENHCNNSGCLFGRAGNALYRNANDGQHKRLFVDATDAAGVRNGSLGWGATMFDMNNDKYIDFIMTNDLNSTSAAASSNLIKLWVNQGQAAQFATINMAVDVGLINKREGRGLAKFDFDGDGDEDVVVSHLIGRPSLFENLGGNRNFWLRVRVMHRCPGHVYQLCDSLHARVQVTTSDGWRQTQEIGSGAHFMAQNEIEAHFGLGDSSHVAMLYVYWPSHHTFVSYTGIVSNQRLKIILPQSGDSHANATIPYSQLSRCPQLKIASIRPTPRTAIAGASAWVNPSGKTVGVAVGPQLISSVLSFEYTASVEPSDILNGTHVTGMVRIYVNGNSDGHSSCSDSVKVDTTPQRHLNGKSNNMNNPLWGSVAQQLVRDVPSQYGDGIASPAGQCSPSMRSNNKCPFPTEYDGKGSTRPSPREISNKLFHQPHSVPSERHLSDLLVHWGQFLAHDTDHSTPMPPQQPQVVQGDVTMPISVPSYDIHFDPYGTGKKELPFARTSYSRTCTGRFVGTSRQQINRLTSYIDGSVVYGLSIETATKLRTLSEGKMKLQNGGNLPFNTLGVANDNPMGKPPTTLLAAGDARSNEQPALIALHTLFVREHNRQCDIYLAKNPLADDSEVFEVAQKIVIAELQAITFREFLPALFGREMPPYDGYHPDVNADVGNAFSTAAFRYGHSQVNTHLLRFDKDWNVIPEGHLPLRDAYFAPERFLYEGGIDPLLRGAVYQPAQEIDAKIVDDLRNVLFPVTIKNKKDLAAMNIQRGRDHGLPDYNSVRKYIGLPGLNDFSDITSDEETAAILQELHSSIDTIDLWVGGLAEDKENGSSLGPTFEKLLLLNFLRIRDGDRFWYERNMTEQEQTFLHKNLTLSHIIRFNTGFHDTPENVMFASQFCAAVVDHQCVVRMPVTSTPTQQPVVIDKSDSPVTWSDVVHSTGGIVIIAVAVCAVFICIALSVLLFCYCVRKGKKTETKPSSTEVVMNKSSIDF